MTETSSPAQDLAAISRVLELAEAAGMVTTSVHATCRALRETAERQCERHRELGAVLGTMLTGGEPIVAALEEAGLLAGPVAAYLLAVPLPDGLPPNVITAYARRDLAEATAVKQTELNNCEYRVYEIREVNRG